MEKELEFVKILQDKKLISSEQAEKLKSPDFDLGKIGNFLISENILDSEALCKIKAELFKLPYENLLDRAIPEQVLNTIPLEAATNYRIVCFERNGYQIKVGITDPEDYKAMEAINFLAKKENLDVEFFLITEESFKKASKQYQDFNKEIGAALQTRAEEQAKEKVKNKAEEKNEELEEVIKSAPVAKIVSVIIRHAVEGGASDIHIEPGEKESRVRYRIDGLLHTSLTLPKNVHGAIVARIKVLADLKLDETRMPQDGRIRLSIDQRQIDFRVSVLPLVAGEKVVMRILDTTKGAPTLQQLGFEGRALKVIEENIKKTNGLFLVTGPTGSGKSMTLFAILNRLNKEGVNISTIEDPVEYFLQGVNQSQIKPEIGFTFASGLRSFLRQDPDIIMVGEIRDNETAELAIHAGLTGHFVLSTLHTNDAVGAVPRLMDMKVEPFLLGSTLNVVVAQRLVRKICPFCRIEEKLPEDLLVEIEKQIKDVPEKILKQSIKDFKSVRETTFYKGKGCSRCGNSGYSGRIAISEVFDINDKIKNIIFDETKNLQFKDVKASQDFVSLMQDGVIKVLKGDTTVEEILRVSRD